MATAAEEHNPQAEAAGIDAGLGSPTRPVTATTSTSSSSSLSQAASPSPARGDAVMLGNTGIKREAAEREDSQDESHRRTRARSADPKQPPQAWDAIPPLHTDIWKQEILDLLFFEWNADKDHRLLTWVNKHSSPEMVATVEATEEGKTNVPQLHLYCVPHR